MAFQLEALKEVNLTEVMQSSIDFGDEETAIA